jgi:hypothetical protein
MHCKY